MCKERGWSPSMDSFIKSLTIAPGHRVCWPQDLLYDKKRGKQRLTVEEETEELNRRLPMRELEGREVKEARGLLRECISEMRQVVEEWGRKKTRRVVKETARNLGVVSPVSMEPFTTIRQINEELAKWSDTEKADQTFNRMWYAAMGRGSREDVWIAQWEVEVMSELGIQWDYSVPAKGKNCIRKTLNCAKQKVRADAIKSYKALTGRDIRSNHKRDRQRRNKDGKEETFVIAWERTVEDPDTCTVSLVSICCCCCTNMEMSVACHETATYLLLFFDFAIC